MDDSTGLPALPEGQFWRVSQSMASTYVDVIRRQKTWYGSRKVGESHPVTKSEATPKEVRAAAMYILWKEKKAPDADRRKVLGDYPPKKLEP